MKILLILILVFAGIKNSFSQNFDFHVVTQEWAHYDYYLDLGKRFDIYIDGYLDGLDDGNIKKAKLKSQGLVIGKQEQPFDFNITPIKTGKTVLTAKVKLDNGKTIFIEREYEVVDLPELRLEIDVTSPDSKFSWLKILDESSGEALDLTPYNFHWLDFQLMDSLGQHKESEVYVNHGKYWLSTDTSSNVNHGDFFPSVTLINLHTEFEIGDQLDVCISLIHKKYGLYLNCCQTITIKGLWK